MICIIALVVFGILGIFSTTHREYARDAFDCVFRRVTLRPCNTGFDQKMRGKIVGRIFTHSPKVAGAVNKHFEAISWFFTILMIASFAYTAYGMYNLAVFGTCDPANPQNCVFNALDPNKVTCPFADVQVAQGIGTIGNFIKVENTTEKKLVYYLGTSWCPHCKWEKPIFEKAAAKFTDIEVREVIMDVSATAEDKQVFAHFSPTGSIPVLVLGGKYYRIGSGEALGAQADEEALTALMCTLSENGKRPAECSDPVISKLIEGI